MVPGVLASEQQSGEIGQDDAGSDGELIGGNHRAPDAQRCGLGDEERRDHGGDADGEAKHETRHHQHPHRADDGGDHGADCEQGGGHHQHAAASECLGQFAGQDGAYQRAQRDCGGGEAVLQRRHWKGVLEGWTGDGDDALVVAEQQSGDRGDGCQEVDHVMTPFSEMTVALSV
jgi:hypothetical protein